MAACHFCHELLSDFNTIVDQIKLIIRLITLTLQQDRTRETNERLQMLRSHLVEQNENMDNILFVLAVRCDICGNAY